MPAFKVINEYIDEESETCSVEIVVWAPSWIKAKGVAKKVFIEDFPEECHYVDSVVTEIDVYDFNGNRLDGH